MHIGMNSEMQQRTAGTEYYQFYTSNVFLLVTSCRQKARVSLSTSRICGD